MLALGRAYLERHGVEEARLDAELLVAAALGLDRLGLYMQLERPVQEAEVERARALLQRRARREPVAYVLGRREFYGRDFEVTRDVLVPRPETELLVDIARERFAGRGAPQRPWRVGDFGTGSGCLALTLALELDGVEVVAVDRSHAAVEVARRNAERLGAGVEILCGEGLELLARSAQAAGRGFDLLVANPPYVQPEERAALAPEVREHEPALALFAPPGEPDHWLRRILDGLDELVAPGGLVLVELAAGRGAHARTLAAQRQVEARLHRDLAGHERVIELRRSG